MKAVFSLLVKSLYLPVIVLFSVSCSDKEEPVPSAYIEGLEAQVLPQKKVKLTGEIKNWNATAVLDWGFFINSIKYSAGVPSSDKVELIIDDLKALTAYQAYPYVEIAVGNGASKVKQTYNPLSFTIGIPIVESIQPITVTDYSIIKIKGEGLDHRDFRLYLKTKSSPEGEEKIIKMFTKNATDTEMEVYVPNIGARGKDLPLIFNGPIQPCAIYGGDLEGSILEKISDINYTYRFHLLNQKGSKDGTFAILAWYARDNPSLDEIEVYFGDTKRVLQEKKFSFNFTSYEELEAYRLTYNVPFGTESGETHKIRVFSPFGEEFICIGSNEFIVE